jgi:hypothetical protein
LKSVELRILLALAKHERGTCCHNMPSSVIKMTDELPLLKVPPPVTKHTFWPSTPKTPAAIDPLAPAKNTP